MSDVTAYLWLLGILGSGVGIVGVTRVSARMQGRQQRKWERAKRRAQWEEHTDASQDTTQDGTPIAEVTVRKVARMGHRCEVLETRPVTKVPAPDAFAPELIEAQALAWARADTLNQLKAAGL